jgi:uncharacterized protein (TIGR00369 family)
MPPQEPTFSPRDPDFESRVRESFSRQGLMATLGAELSEIRPGYCEIRLPFRDDLSQQHGFFHAGATGAIADSAGGYAAYTLMPAGSSVMSVEYKINLLAPADGERLVASGQVVRAGRTLTVCDLEVIVEKAGTGTLCARGMQTLICLQRGPRGAEAG